MLILLQLPTYIFMLLILNGLILKYYQKKYLKIKKISRDPESCPSLVTVKSLLVIPALSTKLDSNYLQIRSK